MPPVVSLVGKPDCGKTTLLEKLIPELNRCGYRVGTIKHHVHEFEMDTPGKDTWRHKQAGAHTVVLSSPQGIGIIKDVDHDAAIEELVGKFFDDVDLVITEGYKGAGAPKIEVFRSSAHPTPLKNRDETWIALVTDVPLRTNLPEFSPDDVPGIAVFLIDQVLKKSFRPQTILQVNGAAIPLTRFIAELLRKTVTSMVTTLKGCKDPKNITITIRND